MAYTPSNPNGQATMANSAPVVIASNQSSVQTQLATDLLPTSGTITTAASVVTVTDLSGVGSVSVQISGTYAGVNVTFEASLDGTIWNAIPAQQASSINPSMVTTTGVLTTNSTNVWNVAPLLGQQQFRVRATAYTSGTANVFIEPSAQFTQPIVNIGTMPAVSGAVTVSANAGAFAAGANNVLKAEDAAHASGDLGVEMLAIRNDNAGTALTSATGDYSGVAVDINGTQFTRDAPSNTGTLSNVAAATASTTLLAANAARRNAIVYNDSTSDMYLKYGTAASSTSFTLYVPSLATVAIPGSEYAGIITGIWISAAGNARVTETTL